MKKWLVIVWVFGLFAVIAWQFWYHDVKYSLPTPVPQSYQPPRPGDKIDLNSKISISGKPVFLHFFNPSCPCSRFNIPHVRSLANKYGNEINFGIVVMSNNKTHSVEEIQDKFGINVPVFFDKSIASLCGVYSTPQAVIINADSKLYYRGNYNKSRYCTDQNSNYAQMAIDSLLGQAHKPVFNQYALKAYGCQIPDCIK